MRNPLGSRECHMCSNAVMLIPWGTYCAAVLYMGYRASKGRAGRPPGFFWQFQREAYSQEGWLWHRRSMWMFAGAFPFAIVLGVMSHVVCPP